MSLWILDTDHVSMLLSGNQIVRDRVRPVSRDVALTIVTVQEIFNGWVNLINDPAQAENLPEIHTRLWVALNYFRDVQVINFDDVANECHQRLLQENKTLNRKGLQKDMRIAAIALSLGATLVTRNYRVLLRFQAYQLKTGHNDPESDYFFLYSGFLVSMLCLEMPTGNSCLLLS